MIDANERGPNGLARECEDTIAKLLVERETADAARRKAINKHLKLVRDMLAWCKSRAGYRPLT